MARFCSSQTWVIPSFSPTIAFVAISRFLWSRGRSARESRRSVGGLAVGFPRERAPTDVGWGHARREPGKGADTSARELGTKVVVRRLRRLDLDLDVDA